MQKKTTPKIKEEMKLLREKGWAYKAIGDKFSMTQSAVRYHLVLGMKEAGRIRRRKSHKKHGPPSKRHPEKTREYIREYMRERRRNDPEFCERQNKASRKSYRKRTLHKTII